MISSSTAGTLAPVLADTDTASAQESPMASSISFRWLESVGFFCPVCAATASMFSPVM